MASTTDALADHGDRQVPPGAVDLAVNVVAHTPGWLRAELAGVDLARYPDPAPAVRSAAARHGVLPQQCLLTNGAAEAFWAIAFGLRPRLAACVHPSFTAPEAALRAAGVPVRRVLRDAGRGFRLDPGSVPDDADLVVLGRPDNPTGRLDPLEVVRQLARPGRVVVVDEAFADFLPDPHAAAGTVLPGVLRVRSLTKLWGLAGLRVGYLLGPAELLDAVGGALQPWPVNALAAHAVQRLSGAERERAARAKHVASARDELVQGLHALRWPGLRVWASPANFVLLRTHRPDLRAELLDAGIAVRRCDTFPGLDRHYVRLAVPVPPGPRQRLLGALERLSG